MPMPLGAVGITSFTQTASGPLKYEVSVALRRASMLSCCFPEVALAKPGSSNTTHESLAISVKLNETSGLSVFTRISVPARTVLELTVIVKSLPLRDRKSTRLNSSHVAISYAVFCLKKKKTKREQNIKTKKYQNALIL